MITFSLDCERIWGFTDKVDNQYLENNIRYSDSALKEIIARWDNNSSELTLAFVLSSLPNYDIPEDIVSKKKKLLKSKWDEELTKFSDINFSDLRDKNITLGVHSTSHDLYINLEQAELEKEIRSIEEFIFNNSEFNRLFVYPKNLTVPYGIDNLSNHFQFIRVNGNSWLYRSDPRGVSVFKRIIRYLDSFLPIYELFCSKKPEIYKENIVLGTHFFRANLRGILLSIHIFRIIFGIKLLKIMGHDAHIWSHPHNFSGNKKAIDAFASFGRMNGSI